MTASEKNGGSPAVAAPVDHALVSLPAIQARLDALAVAMSGKALREPDATFSLRSGSEARVSLTWWNSNDPKRSYSANFMSDSFKTLDEAEAWVADLPSPEQVRLTAFLTSLDETIQLGKKADVDVEVINPMLEVFKRISKSAITHQPAESP